MLEWGALLLVASAAGTGLPAPQVAPATGDAYQPVTISVAAPSGAGTISFRDGDRVIAASVPVTNGVARITTNALGDGEHQISAVLDGVGADQGAARDQAGLGNPATVSFGSRAPVGNVVVVIPAGSLTVTAAAPGIAGGPLAIVPSSVHRGEVQLGGITVTDTRAGNLGFTVTATVLSASPSQRLGPVAAYQVPNNAMRATDVRTSDRSSAGRSHVIASYPAGISTGSVVLRGLASSGHRDGDDASDASDRARQTAGKGGDSGVVRVLVTAW